MARNCERERWNKLNALGRTTCLYSSILFILRPLYGVILLVMFHISRWTAWKFHYNHIPISYWILVMEVLNWFKLLQINTVSALIAKPSQSKHIVYVSDFIWKIGFIQFHTLEIFDNQCADEKAGLLGGPSTRMFPFDLLRI